MLCRRSVIHFAGVSLSCTSPYSPSFFRHDEEILGQDQEHPDRWRHGFAVHRATSPCWARITFNWPLPSGVVPLFAVRAIHLQSARRPLRPAGVVEKGGFAAAAFGVRNTNSASVGMSAKNFVMTKFFEIGTQTSSAALGHCQSLVVVVIVLLRLLLPMQVW